MRNSIAIFMFALVVLLPRTAVACSPGMPDAREEAQHADAILIGFVTGERYPEYEEHLLSGGSPKTAPLGRRMVRVVFTETLKGRIPAPLEIRVPCAAPFPWAQERVIVFRRAGRDDVTPADFPKLESELREALTGGR